MERRALSYMKSTITFLMNGGRNIPPKSCINVCSNRKFYVELTLDITRFASLPKLSIHDDDTVDNVSVILLDDFRGHPAHEAKKRLSH